MAKQHTLFICKHCPHDAKASEKVGPKLIAKIKEAIKEHPDLEQDFYIEAVKCMGGCEKPTSIAVSGNNKHSILFNEVETTDEQVQDILVYLKQYQNKEDGRVLFKYRPKSLQTNLLVRIPGHAQKNKESL